MFSFNEQPDKLIINFFIKEREFLYMYDKQSSKKETLKLSLFEEKNKQINNQKTVVDFPHLWF